MFKSLHVLRCHKISAHKNDESGKYKKYDPLLKLIKKGNEGVKFSDPHTCCLCQKVLAKRRYLKTHLKGVHKKGQLMFCDLCPKVYNDKVLFLNHMKVHRKIYFACELCDFETVYKCDLKAHQRTHGPKMKCKICGKETTSRKHMKFHLPREKCPVCKKLVGKAYFKDHLKRHEKNKIDLKCKKCGETFETYEKLRM